MSDTSVAAPTAGLPSKPDKIQLATPHEPFDWKRLLFMGIGLGLFFLVYYAPPFPDAVDPKGEIFALSKEGKAAIALFLLAGTWWVFEVVPIGITSNTHHVPALVHDSKT